MTDQTTNNQIARLLNVDGNDPNAVRKGLAASPLSASNNLVSMAEDGNYATRFEAGFNFSTIPTGLVLTEEGTTTAAATYSGQATITSDDVAAKTDQLTTPLSWRVDKQIDKPLIAVVKWKTGATITASEYWIGLTDASPDTDPIALSTTSTFTTSVPTDGVYMGYSATPTSGAAFTTGGNQHTAIAIKADTNSIVATGFAPFVAATFYTYRFELDATTGDCRYYINGRLLATQAAALTTTAPLCLMICAAPRTTASAVITTKYLGVFGAGTA